VRTVLQYSSPISRSQGGKTIPQEKEATGNEKVVGNIAGGGRPILVPHPAQSRSRSSTLVEIGRATEESQLPRVLATSCPLFEAMLYSTFKSKSQQSDGPRWTESSIRGYCPRPHVVDARSVIVLATVAPSASTLALIAACVAPGNVPLRAILQPSSAGLAAFLPS
jgi:hypothetical protein